MGSKLAIIILTVASLFGQITSAYAQQGNTVFATITSGQTADGNFVIPAQYKIGQSGHQAIMLLSDTPGHTCLHLGVYGTIALQGSYDNVSWVNISSTVQTYFPNNNGAVGIGSATGQGLYPFVRIAATSNSTTTCQYALYYGAIVNSVATAPNTVGPTTYSNIGSNVNSNYNLATEKGARTLGGVTGLAGAAANRTLVFPTTALYSIDCISMSMTATATLAPGGYDTFSLNGGSLTFVMGLPTGATVGTTVSRDICGLNQALTFGTQTIGFTAGVTNVIESVSFSYFSVSLN